MDPQTVYDYHTWLTDLGPLAALGRGDKLVGLFLTPQGPAEDLKSARRQGTGRVKENRTPLLDRVETQVNQYLTGQRRRFELDLEPAGTPFQLQVWQALQKVPFGQVVTYGQLAAQAGRPKAVRAVGGAMNANPIPIIIPCHRVIAAGGLGGFGGGLARKVMLLGIEGVTQARLCLQKDLPFEAEQLS